MVQQKLKKPKAILFDVIGTAVRHSFIDKSLIPYFQAFSRYYLEENWDKIEAQEDIDRIRNEGPPPGSGLVNIPPKVAMNQNTQNKTAIIDAVVNFAEHCIEKKIETKGYIMLRLVKWILYYLYLKIISILFNKDFMYGSMDMIKADLKHQCIRMLQYNVKNGDVTCRYSCIYSVMVGQRRIDDFSPKLIMAI